MHRHAIDDLSPYINAFGIGVHTNIYFSLFPPSTKLEISDTYLDIILTFIRYHSILKQARIRPRLSNELRLVTN